MSKEYKTARALSAARAVKIVDQFAAFLDPGESYLSVGDGDGYVTAEAQQRCRVGARGLDLRIDMPFRAPGVPLDYYDGGRMPYADKSIDVVTAVFVLHHCDQPEAVLAEMQRVARKKIIIIEDVYRNRLERMMVCLLDYLENRMVSSGMNIPLHFRKATEWEELFRQQGLKLVLSRRFALLKLLPVRHQVFCLRTD